MVSLLLSLSLSQVVWPPVSSLPFQVEASMEPIQVQGAPALVWSGTNYVALWLDRRRSLDLPGAPLDVWAGTWSTAQSQIDGRLVSELSGAYSEPRLAAEPMGNVRAAWVRTSDAGGSVEHTRFAAQLIPHLPGRSALNDTATGTIERLELAATPTSTAFVMRRAASLTISRLRPSPSINAFAVAVKSTSLIATDTGALYLHEVNGVGDLSGTQLLEPSGLMRGLNPLSGLGIVHVAGIGSQPPSQVVIQTASGELKRQLSDGGSQTIGTNAGRLPPLALGVPSGAVVLYEIDGGAALRLSTESASLSGTNLPGITPLAVAGADPELLIASRENGAIELRVVTRSGTVLNPSAGIPAFRAPTPQLNATAGWSAVDDGFMMLWDQRDGGAWETRAAVVDVSGPRELGAVITAQPTWSNPRLAVSPDAGALFVAFGPPGNRHLYSTLGGLPQTQVLSNALDEVAIGERSTFTWSPSAGVSRHSSSMGTRNESISRGCVRWWNGEFWYLPRTPLVLRHVDENGLSSDMALLLPVTSSTSTHRCVTVTRLGGLSLTLGTDAGLDVYAVGPGKADLLARAALPLSEPPATTAAGDGVVVVAPLVPDGQRPTLRFLYAAPGITTSDDLNGDTQPVRGVSATTDPSGLVMVTWETFELDAGAWKVQSRLIRPPFPDAGELDAGAPNDGGSADAGSFDAGSFDAGAFDAGSFDASVDAGGPDAGVDDGGSPPDSGTPDAGAMGDAGQLDAGGTIDGGPEFVTFVPVCGCSSSASGAGLFFALLLVLRSLKGRR